MGGKARGRECYVALMRGLNVGGNNRLPMIALRALFEEAGCSDVRSYIQSGNVIFTASPGLAQRLSSTVHAAMAQQYGYRVPVVLRRARDMRPLAEANPFLRAGLDPKQLYLMCLDRVPSAAQVATLDPDRSRPDAFSVQGNNIYLHLPHGAARSKLTNAYFDQKLGSSSTVRNWNTWNKLIELSAH